MVFEVLYSFKTYRLRNGIDEHIANKGFSGRISLPQFFAGSFEVRKCIVFMVWKLLAGKMISYMFFFVAETSES
jgi:hypothetical protein